ncbi:hypothetical protein SNE40_001675 [Patella caerulea]|uniref:Uncharacterized protein n=1 Tax=Patella caerulea TaxID=87958 RepID=A0AAN8Q3T4_PATCE
MPHHACDHEENRTKVCLVCFKKGASTIQIKEGKVLCRVRQFYIENYDPQDGHMPSGICSRCRNLLLDIETGKQPMDCLPDPFDFSKVVSPSVATRNNPSPSLSCQCMICLVARSNPVTSKLGKRFSTSQTPTPGRPPTACTPDTLPSPRPIRVCKRCWQPVGRGVSHPSPCTASDARDNVIQRVQDVPRAAEILSSDVIRQKAGTSGTVTLATRGRDLTVEVGKTSKISTLEDLRET